MPGINALAGIGDAQHAEYPVEISGAVEDREWDSFLARTAGGHHVQTSLWAQVKASLGWWAERLIIRREGQIVAGAQVLMRPLPLVGAIGYVPKGPLFASDEPALLKLVVSKLHEVAKAHNIQHLIVQPPNNGQEFAQQLPRWGFQATSVELAPTATVWLDLTEDLDTILGEMKSKTRYNIRLGKRRGITVREGNEDDLHTYYDLLAETSQRQEFLTFPKSYFLKMWSVFAPHGYIKLFLAEYEGEVVSAQLAVPFGDTVINKLSVWSGHHGRHRPNEVLQWAAIEWAKAHGYHIYDCEGIKLEAAKMVLNNQSLPDSLKQTVTSFKLGFGGRVTLFPQAYDYVYNPLLRWGYQTVFPRMASTAAAKIAREYLRTCLR